MRKPIRRKSPNSLGATTPAKPLIDVWLQRSVWTVQVLLFPLAIFGYVFTVRPVYQKQLLDEKIAERAVFYRKAMLDVEKLTAQQARLTTENARLAADTTKLYSSLRANVLGALPSVAQACGFDPKLTGGQLYACIHKAINEQINPALNKSDQIKLEGAVVSQRIKIMSLPELVDKQLRESSLRNQADSDALDRKLENLPRNFVAKIQKMRGAQQTKARTIKELGELRTGDEANAYMDLQEEAQRLILKRHSLTMDKLVLTSTGISPASSELRKVMDQIGEEMRR